MAVPLGAATFEAYAGVVYNGIRDAMRSGRVVVVTWDEPEITTHAKRLEQARRDAAATKRKHVACSADLARARPDATFDRAALHRMADVHALKEDRPARAKLFDELALAVLRRATEAATMHVY